MANFIKIKYFDYFRGNESTYTICEYFDKKENLSELYINPASIASIRKHYSENSNKELVEHTHITLLSNETIFTFMTVDEILEKINGKPKK